MNCRGFTITELLVATLLLSLVSAGGLAAWSHGSAAWREASLEQVLHERAQYVFATLEPELQMAGYFGQSPAPAPLAVDVVPNAARSCGVELVRRLDQPVAVAATYALPCAARGGGAVAGSAQLVLRRASAQLATATSGRAQWLGSATAGELTWNDTAITTAAPDVERRDLLLRVYYIARSADGDAATPALRMKNLSSVAGVPAFIDTEVMPGVETLQAELLPAPGAPRSVRITLTLRLDQADMRVRRAPRRLTVTREFSLRNAPAG
jgi:prepilin-type N-terminal cleavage/methylation domain-containing protein